MTHDQNDVQALRDIIYAGWRTQIVFAGVKAGLFDALGEQPRDAGACAAELGLDEETVFRVLRALASLSLCRHVDRRSFALTPMGSLLRSDAENSQRGQALHWGGRTLSSLATIGHTLETGEPGRGKGDFAGLNASAFDSQAFNRAMADQSRPVARALAQAHDFSGYKLVMDVGGGYGGLLSELLLAFPQAQGAINDLPAVEPGARTYLQEAGVAERVRYIGGNFFEDVAPDADCLLLKYILHDWDDGECAAIMANCRRALEPGERLLIVERIMPERVDAHSEAVVRADMVMMPINGRERTLAELEAMATEAGFALDDVKPLVDDCSLIELRAV